MNSRKIRYGTLIYYRSMVKELPSLILLAIFFLLTTYFTFIHPFGIIHIDFELFSKELEFSLSLFSIASIMLLMVLLHKLYDERLVIGPDHVQCTTGTLSFTRKDMRIDFVNIRGIEIDCSLYDRIFNLGNVHIGSSMHEEVEIKFVGLRNPELIRKVIESRCNREISAI